VRAARRRRCRGARGAASARDPHPGARARAGGCEASDARLAEARAEAEAADECQTDALRNEARLSERLRALENEVAEAESHRAQRDALAARLGPEATLAQDLRSDRFQAWLLEEAFAELLQGASRRLLDLTGRYGLEYAEDAFYVVDHDNAGERRSAEP